MALDRIVFDGSETGQTVGEKINEGFDEIEKRAAAYDSTKTYEKGEIVTDSNNKIRIANTAIITPESFDESKWDVVIPYTPKQETGQATYVADFDEAIYFEYTLDQDATIDTPDNVSIGDEGTIIIKQNATGGWNITLAAEWIMPAGSPGLNTNPNAYNVFKYVAVATDTILLEFIADFVI